MNHEYYMELALAQAKHAWDLDEIPVGAVVVYEQQIIGCGYNQTISTNDPSAHAEIVAMRAAARHLNNYRLTNCSLYVTLEPCCMCAMALIHARIKNLYFGAFDYKTGACFSCFDLIFNKKHNHKIYVQGGIKQKECAQLLSDFFIYKRMLKKTKNVR